MERDHKEMVQRVAGDLADAAWYLYLRMSLQPQHCRIRIKMRPRYRRVPHRIFGSTAAGVGEFPAVSDVALDSVAASASRDKNSIFFEVTIHESCNRKRRRYGVRAFRALY